MKTPAEILKDAKSAKEKDTLAPHEQAIRTLREKSYSWREIAKFLCDRGIDADHSKVFRFIHKNRGLKMDMRPENIPSAEQYAQALKELKITDKQREMLKFHYNAHNRMATYTELAKAAGSDHYQTANSGYGRLGYTLGAHLGVPFTPLPDKDPESEFYSSAIGIPVKFEDTEWMLIMHHELAKALDTLGWFKKSSLFENIGGSRSLADRAIPINRRHKHGKSPGDLSQWASPIRRRRRLAGRDTAGNRARSNKSGSGRIALA